MDIASRVHLTAWHEGNSLRAAMRHVLALSVFDLDPLMENRKEEKSMKYYAIVQLLIQKKKKIPYLDSSPEVMGI